MSFVHPVEFGRIVDYLGAPSEVMLGYRAFGGQYGRIARNIKIAMGRGASIANDISLVATRSDEPLEAIVEGVEPENLKDFYRRSINTETGVACPVFVDSREELYGSEGFYGRKIPKDPTAAIYFNAAKWNFERGIPMSIVVVTPEQIDIKKYSPENARLGNLFSNNSHNLIKYVFGLR